MNVLEAVQQLESDLKRAVAHSRELELMLGQVLQRVKPGTEPPPTWPTWPGWSGVLASLEEVFNRSNGAGARPGNEPPSGEVMASDTPDEGGGRVFHFPSPEEREKGYCLEHLKEIMAKAEAGEYRDFAFVATNHTNGTHMVWTPTHSLQRTVGNLVLLQHVLNSRLSSQIDYR